MYQLIWSPRRAAARLFLTTSGRWCWTSSRPVVNCLQYIKASAENGSKSVKPKLMRRTGRIVRSATSGAEQQVQEAIRIIREGGVLQNDTVEFYRSRHDSSACSIFLYLMRQYQVDVPLRTQGWINERLANATIADGRCSHLQFWGHRRDRASQRFIDCMNELIRAVAA